MMPPVLSQVLGLILRRRLTDTTMYSSKSLLIMVYRISFSLINEAFSLTGKRCLV